MSTPTLLSPISIGNNTLNHRIVLSPCTRLRNTESGIPQELGVEYYRQRATNGGLLITEATVISPASITYKCAPGIYSDDQIEGWKKVVEAVHSKGAIIFLQLWHVGRATASKLLPDGQVPVSASAIAIQGPNMIGEEYEVPRELTVEQIKETIQDYVVAAKNALAAGFDGVEIHGANGYLIDQFINTSSNTRTDEYGGSIANRARFGLEVVDALVEAIGAQKVAIRLSPWSEFQDMKDDTPVETWSYITQELQNKHANLAYLHFAEPREVGLRDEPNEQSADSLDPFRDIWKGPFISTGGYLDGKKAIQLCEERSNNLVAFGRMFIANPDLVERIRNDWPLNKYNRPTFYTPGPEGYIDYPFYSAENETSNVVVEDNGAVEDKGIVEDNGTVEENATVEINATLESNGTVDSNGTVETNGTLDNNGAVEDNEIVDVSSTIDNNGTAENNASIENNGTLEQKVLVEEKVLHEKKVIAEEKVTVEEVRAEDKPTFDENRSARKTETVKDNGSLAVTADPVLADLKGNVRELMKHFQLSK